MNPSLIVFTVCAAVCGCGLVDRPAPDPSFPEAGFVTALRFLNPSHVGAVPEVESLLEHLAPLKGGWHLPNETYPTPRATVLLLDRSGNALCHVHIGSNWVGSSCGQSKRGQPPVRTVSAAQAQEFKRLVGGTC